MIHRTLQRSQRSVRNQPKLVASPEYLSLIRTLAGRTSSPVIRSLGITSSRPGEGVSTIARQCAVAATQLFHQSTLLVEASMRRPSLGRALKLDAAPGFGDLLLERCELSECVQQVGEHLAVVTAGGVSQRDLQSCSAASIAQAVDSLLEGRRLTVWDLPAVEEGHLALELATQLDGVLVVVESERTLSELAQQSVERLRVAGVKVLGAVLNKQRQYLPRWLSGWL